MPMFLPVTDQVFLSKGPAFADRVVALAEQDDRIFKALLRASKYSGYLGLASIASTISVAVMVDLGTMRHDSWIAQRVVGEEIAAVIGQQRPASNGANPDTAAVPSGWAPVQ